MAANANPMRAYVRTVLEKYMTEPEAGDMEVGIFNNTIDVAKTFPFAASWGNPVFNEAYLAKARSLVANLNPQSYVKNERLQTRLAEREFMPNEMAAMAPENLFPEAWDDVIQKEMHQLKGAYETNLASMTDVYTCGKCKKNRCTYYEFQGRSGDEASDIHVRCLNCGNRWKH